MERPLLDALHTTQAASAPAPTASSASRGSVGLFPASGARERALPANPGLASFPHEDVEPMRSYPPPSTGSNSGAGVPSAASAAAGTVGFRFTLLIEQQQLCQRSPPFHLAAQLERVSIDQEEVLKMIQLLSTSN
ncbi:hypothetical protein KRP22_001275 [Phytophthora ramorum]|nr:hypothetical protein KRP22_7317 [Phytophthora ramorum]